MDSAPVERLVKLFADPTHHDNIWFDERWLSGDWHEEISGNMIASDVDLCLKDHLQPLPSLYPSTGSRQSPPSSALRSITAHLDSITVKIPNPMNELSSFRRSDVVARVQETTVLVTNDLPPSFLSGEVAAENNSYEFPHDPADISTTKECSEERTTFRMQISLTDCSLVILPVQAYSLAQDERVFTHLIAPTNVTALMSLEHFYVQQSPTAGTVHLDYQRSLVLSLLIQALSSNVELRSIHGALETLTYHAETLMGYFSSPGSLESGASPEDIDTMKTTSIICLHLPELDINLWGGRANTNGRRPGNAEVKNELLCRVRASGFEFGVEITNIPSQDTLASVYKCAITSVLLDICSRADNSMIQILTMGTVASESSHLVEKACRFLFGSESRGVQQKRGFFLRSESTSHGNTQSSANAVEISAPLSVDLNLPEIEFFMNLVVECLLSPVFVGTGRQIGQTLLGSALWSTISKMVSLFGSPAPEPTEMEDIGGVANSLFRIYLQQLLMLVPSNDESRGPFGLTCTDVEIASGGSREHTTCRQVMNKSCGFGGQTWLNAFSFPEDVESSSPSDFYVLKSTHGMVRVERNVTTQFETIFPSSSINWSLPAGLGHSSTAPPFDVFAAKELCLLMMNMGMPLSSLYFKLYKLSPQNEAQESEFSLAAVRLHDSLGSYHRKMHACIEKMSAEVDQLTNAVFLKENERVGALALASSEACGWIRACEDLSFSHRIFSSATFFRYWMVLNKSTLILSKDGPGTQPAFIVPIRPSCQLRALTLSSSSGIVGSHVKRNGFALFDSEEGTGLFFCAANASDCEMWVRAISSAVHKGERSAPITDSSMDAQTPLDCSVTEQAMDAPPASTELLPQTSSPFIDAAPPDVGTSNQFTEEAANPDAAINDDPFCLLDAPGPATSTPQDIVPATVESFDSCDDMMDVISLGDSERGPNSDNSVCIENSSSTVADPLIAPPSSVSSSTQEPQNVTSMRERLAVAKGKSKSFGMSALKTAKGGMLAAGEISRDGVKQAMTRESAQGDDATKRSLAVGQKMSLLKRNASTKLTDKLTAARAGVSSTSTDTSVPSSSSRDETPGARKLDVGQKMSVLKKNAGTKLTSLGTSVRSAMQDQPNIGPNAEGGQESPEVPQAEVTATRSSKQELRKKLAGLDQTVRRLKIDEKVTQLSAAVKQGIINDPVVRQMSRNNENSRRRLGIGEESKTIKPIKFDARETFSASSDFLPLKIKSSASSSGQSLLLDLSEQAKTLQKIPGTWVVEVHATRVTSLPLAFGRANDDVSGEKTSSADQETSGQAGCTWIYSITATDVSGEWSTGVSAERSITEVLAFHTRISETFANHMPLASELSSREGTANASAHAAVFGKLSSMERLRVSGSLLQRVLEVSANNSVSAGCSHCEYCAFTTAYCIYVGSNSDSVPSRDFLKAMGLRHLFLIF